MSFFIIKKLVCTEVDLFFYHYLTRIQLGFNAPESIYLK